MQHCDKRKELFAMDFFLGGFSAMCAGKLTFLRKYSKIPMEHFVNND